MKRPPIWSSLLLLGVLLACPTVHGQQLIYQPKNPAFGGFSSNYSWLMQSAEAQKNLPASTTTTRDPLQSFQQNLQSQLLSRLASELVFNRFGSLDLTKAGIFDFGDFRIQVTPGLDAISIRIFNILTGSESTVSVPRF